MSRQRYVVALDVGGTKVACGLFREDGAMLYHHAVPTCQESAADSIAQLVAATSAALSRAPKDGATAGIGIIVPGWVNHKARTVWAPNIRGWDHIPLQQMLADKIPLPIILDSDRSGYVKGEGWLGIARGLKDVVFVAVGTGIGAGILVNGEIVHGHDDLAGAVGWLALNPQFQEIYSRMGCFEAEASGGSVDRIGREALGVASSTTVTAKEVLEAADSGNVVAAEIVNRISVYLGMGVANLISTLNPEMIVLGGGLFQTAGLLLNRVREECLRWAQPIAVRRTRIEISSLGERAGLAGAARIALDNT